MDPDIMHRKLWNLQPRRTWRNQIAWESNLHCSILLVPSQHPEVYSSFSKCLNCFWYALLDNKIKPLRPAIESKHQEITKKRVTFRKWSYVSNYYSRKITIHPTTGITCKRSSIAATPRTWRSCSNIWQTSATLHFTPRKGIRYYKFYQYLYLMWKNTKRWKIDK